MATQKIPGRAIKLGNDTAGDITYFDGSAWQRLPIGSAGHRLTMNEDGTAPRWGPTCLFTGTQKGYACGGLGGSNVYHDDIIYWSFASDGNGTEGSYGDLQRGARFLGGHSSQTHGYTSGGYAGVGNTVVNVIDRFSFTTEGNSTDWADLSNITCRSAAVSSCTHGFAAGGTNEGPSTVTIDVIDKFPFATQTNATDWANLTENKYAGAGCSSSSHGYMMGGVSTTAAMLNVIENYPYATQTNASDVSDITLARHSPAGNSSTTHGYVSGGCIQTASIANSDIVDKMSFATGGNSTDHGDLSMARRHPSGASSDTHGYTAGGNFGSTASPPIDALTDRIDKFAYASNITATDVGNLYFQGSDRELDGCSGHQY